MRNLAVPALLFAVALTLLGCSKQLSPEDKARVEALKSELATIRTEIAQADARNSVIAGGAMKTLVEMRLETLKLTEALVQQRIQAIESGAKITVNVAATQTEPKRAEEIAKDLATQEANLKAAQLEAARYPGGLIGVMKQMTVATQEQSLAMLRMTHVAAKYGLPLSLPAVKPRPQNVGAATASEPATHLPEQRASEPKIVEVRILRKQFAKQDYQEYVFFDLEFTGKGLDKNARAIKGVLHLQDLFGEPKMNLNWTIDKPLAAGATVLEKGSGFKYNEFMSEHQWARSTALENMTASFTVKSILFADGSRQDF